MTILDQIADILLIGGAGGAAFYCLILSRRLNRFTDLEKGVGGAVAVLSAQVDDMTKALRMAQDSAGSSARELQALTERAEGVSRRLELLLASMHDIPGVSGAAPSDGPADPGGQDGTQPHATTDQSRIGMQGERRQHAPDLSADNAALFRSRRSDQKEAAE